MNNNKYFIIVHLLLFSFCLCEVSESQKEKLLNGFIDYYNNLPNQIYQCDEGSLEITQEVDETTYRIIATIRVTEIRNIEATKLLKCTATVQDSDDDVTVTNNHCEEPGQQSSDTGSQEKTPDAQVEVTEPTVEKKPVQLDNEVQSDTAITSGEQFIAIPRDQPSAPCIGCASHVNPQAAGVSELANLGVRHLDIHEPSVKHSLNSVTDVERQVQVVNGVRYILTLSINSNNCTDLESENCVFSKNCKITILVKPWVKLPNGGNYRSILANNCTEEWQYGDDGEVLPELSSDDKHIKGNTSVDHDDINASDGDIKIKHNTNVQSQPNQERTLTDEELKNLQEQIIPNTQFPETTEPYRHSGTTSPDAPDVSKQHVFKVESGNHNDNSLPVTEQHSINLDKKKAIDDMLDFFDFSGFKPKTETEDVNSRVRRSYDYDLQVLSLAEDYHGIKSSIENARFMYEMAQAMVDYLNEMDMEIKNRAVKNVVKAEEEKENLQRFVYIQARVTIPCDKVECEPKDAVTQICNGVIDSTNENSPQILNTFCYNDNKERDYREVIKEISLDDPVLQKLAEEAVKKMESESDSPYAMKINKIVSAITQVTSGTLTKFSVIVENVKCNKSVPLVLRINCTVLEQLGSKICEVIIHERHWLKERKISYTCTDRPVDMRISKAKSTIKNITVDDPKIIDMLQEAIQYLETQSDKNNKQKLVNIKSISSQIVAGFLTKIEFAVGFTNCTDENYSVNELNNCELLKNEGLRSCKAQIWDRSWIMDGRQVEVSCDDIAKSNEIDNTRKKRSIDFTGGQDPSSENKDLVYKKLANESLKKFMQSSSSRQHYEVIKVDKVQVQDVSGKLIRINFSISPTNCQIQNNGLLSSSKCNIVNPKNILHCRSKILEKVWIDKTQYFVNCNIKDNEQQNNIDGLTERNPSDSKYYQLAEESLTKYLHDTGNSPDHRIVRVEKVTTQIVSGLLTRIDFLISPKNQSDIYNKTISCHSKILEKHWLGTKDLNVSCQMKEKNKADGLVHQNLDNPKYMQIAVESLQKYIKDKPESHLVRVTFVDKVVQVGEKIKIRFIASHTEDDDGDTLCYAEFSETKVFRSDIEVKCHSIGTVLKKTEITEEDPNYYKYVQLADDSLHNHIESINSSQLYTIVSIESVSVQWDEGIKTLINFIISPIDSENSEFQGKQCLAEIREQPWLHKKAITVKCELEKDLYRTKRQVSHTRVRRQLKLGGITERDPTEPRYKALAAESLRKFKLENGITLNLKVVHILKVTTQVVSGTLTRIDFIVKDSYDSKDSYGEDTINCHSEIWEQPWLNNKNIEVSCQNDTGHRVKRQLVGGEIPQDPTDPKYRALAEESLQKYIIDSGIKQPLWVRKVVKVTTQVVSGSLTRIDFIVSGSYGSDIFKCHSKVWEQPWLNNKNIEVSCQNDGHRHTRQIPGGETYQDRTDPKYIALAEESLQKYIIDSGIKEPLWVASVVKVTTQVVAGSLTRIDFTVSDSQGSFTTKCHSAILEQLWLNNKSIKVSCQNNIGHRAKRQIEGGETPQDPTDPKYRALAEESLQKYIIDSGIQEPLRVASVVKVTTQVVAGSLTRIDFTVSSSYSSGTFQCHSKVLEQPWLNNKNIEVSCQNDGHRHTRQIPGGETYQDRTDPKYIALAEESLQKYIIDSGIKEPLRVASVVKVTTQVVAGSLTRIDFTVSSSYSSGTFQCHSKVLEQPWLNNKNIEVSCQNDIGHRVKRQLVGGETPQDPTDPKYIALAEESLQKYVIDSGIQEPLRVASVVKVTTQVVSGSLTRIDFTVSDSQGLITTKCHSAILEQLWLNNKNINVSCQNDIGHRAKRQLVGGETPQDPTDPKYIALAEESLQKYVIDSGIQEPLRVASVVKVTTQVVSGSLTRIDFTVSDSQGLITTKCHSAILEQLWLNNKNINVSCQNDIGHRAKRQLVGGETPQDPTDPKYIALAEESLQKYVIDSGIQEPLWVASVVKVTTQVVAGSLTRIDFTVSDSQGSFTTKCHSAILEQLWLNNKSINVSCQNNIGHRAKRQIEGGETPQDPTDPKYRALAEESLQKYIIDSGINKPLRVASVVKVTTQVVAGSLTRIDFTVSSSYSSGTFQCHSKVLEQPWLNNKNIEVSCQNDIGHRAKLQILGGETPQDPTNPKYRALAEESLQKYIIDSGIQEPLRVASVVKVTTQVVSGSLTRIDFTVSDSQGLITTKCHSAILEQLWLNNKNINVSCQNDIGHRAKRQLVGGETPQDPTDPKYIALAEESLQKYVIDSGIQEPLRVASVVKVTTQVVAGSLTRIDFTVSSSYSSGTFQCHSKVLEQPWLNNKNINVSCQNDIGHRAKRQLLGGLQDQDPSNPEYKALADESLRKYKLENGITQNLQVVRIVKVTTQVVSGFKTRIAFLVSGQDSKIMKCNSEVWEQAWLKKKDISVLCHTIKERVKRDLKMLGGRSEQNPMTLRYQMLGEDLISSSKNSQHVGTLRGHVEEEQDPTKPEYKLLAEESLRKYQQKSTVYHKLVEVKRVVTRVVAGLKYKIDFDAAPTSCSVNVSSVRAHSCKADDDILYCHSDIWDRPWLKKKKIDVKCYSSTNDNDDFEEYETDIDFSLKPPDLKKNNNENYIKLAEEASEKYLTTSNRKYVHKVTEIHSASEQVADGKLTNIDYSLSPTTCLRNETTNNTLCKLKQPLIVFHCNAKIQNRPWLQPENEIKVTCKKSSSQKDKKHKRELGARNVRQIGDDDDEIDEDTTYYYADRAIQHINDRSNSNNLQKLISIHAVQNSVQMGTLTVQMYIEVAETFCLRHHNSKDLRNCEEMNGLNHRLCLARLWPSPDDELVVRHVSVVCDDDQDFVSISGVNIPELLRMSIVTLERDPGAKFKLVHQGEPQVIPSLDSKLPFKINFVVATTNCSVDVNLDKNPFQCYINHEIPSKACHSFIWLKTETKFIRYINAKCTPLNRVKRSTLDAANITLDNLEIQKMVQASLEKLEMSSLHRYKQRVLQINSHSTKITSGKVTTIDFDVGYTSCLKYEWVENITSCDFLEHLPRRRCVAQIWERLWINNGQNIDVNCVDDETPLESHIEFESAEMANELAREALKHIEAKYPHPSKQKIVRIFSLEKQVVAGIHYKMKVEVGFTDCVALSDQTDCKLLKNHGVNKFCRVNVWVRPWTDHPPNFRVSCDFQEGTTHDLYHHVQAEQLFYNFLTTYSPSYVNDYSQMQKRFEIFKNNVKKIHELNVHEKGTAVYGVTRFSDLTYEEFSSTYMGLKTNLSNENQVPMKKAEIPDIKVPANFDWREYDAVTEVKDQGSCGSCWAFSVTGNIEGQWKMQSGQLISLSEQELVDCDKLDEGCNGGLPDNAYRAIEQMGGLELESDYPYEGVDEKCEFNKTLARVQISGAVNITANETGMAQWLVHNGPISIGINANAMQFYMGGISHPWKMLCNPTNLDHGVLIVGYGVKDYPLFHKQLPYWIIKNSWGKSWGEQGYYRVYRGDGTCGVNKMASSAVI